MISNKNVPPAKYKKPLGEQLLDRIDKNPNDWERWEREKAHPASTEVASIVPTLVPVAGTTKSCRGHPIMASHYADYPSFGGNR
jgi:hypothetical protein